MNLSDIKSVHVDNMCYESYPCKHKVFISYTDGKTESMLLNGPSIVNLIIDTKQIVSSTTRDHLHEYVPKNKFVTWTNLY